MSHNSWSLCTFTVFSHLSCNQLQYDFRHQKKMFGRLPCCNWWMGVKIGMSTLIDRPAHNALQDCIWTERHFDMSPLYTLGQTYQWWKHVLFHVYKPFSKPVAVEGWTYYTCMGWTWWHDYWTMQAASVWSDTKASSDPGVIIYKTLLIALQLGHGQEGLIGNAFY